MSLSWSGSEVAHSLQRSMKVIVIEIRQENLSPSSEVLLRNDRGCALVSTEVLEDKDSTFIYRVVWTLPIMPELRHSFFPRSWGSLAKEGLTIVAVIT